MTVPDSDAATTPPPPSRPTAADLLDPDVVDDATALTGEYTPDWVARLPLPPHWQLVALAADTGIPAAAVPARLAVRGPRTTHGWTGTETLGVFAYTGLMVLADVLGATGRILTGQGAQDVTTTVLPLAGGRGVVAERGTGTVTVGDRRIWIQCSLYVAGSDEPRTGRLIEHTLYADAARLPELAGELAALTRAVQDVVTAHLPSPSMDGRTP